MRLADTELQHLIRDTVENGDGTGNDTRLSRVARQHSPHGGGVRPLKVLAELDKMTPHGLNEAGQVVALIQKREVRLVAIKRGVNVLHCAEAYIHGVSGL